MTCPVPHERLVRYWTGDAPEDEIEAIDVHLLGCATCAAASSKIAALKHAFASVIPPFATDHDVARAEARGVRSATNDFRPSEEAEAWLHPGTDLLVHRLLGDLTDVEKVAVDFVAQDGTPILSFADVRFDRAAGALLVACQRHFVERFPPDVEVRVRRTHRGGASSADVYKIRHRVG